MSNPLSGQAFAKTTGEVEQLRGRVAELEARLAHRPAPRKRATRTKS
jgi:BMFP domain-containing protein YqiC